MSKYNNVNPGQYKVAGRQRPGEDIVQKDHKEQFVKNREKAETPARTAKKKRAR